MKSQETLDTSHTGHTAMMAGLQTMRETLDLQPMSLRETLDLQPMRETLESDL